MIIQNVEREGPQRHLLRRSPPRTAATADRALRDVVDEAQARGYDTDERIAKISIVGAGMRTNPGVAAKMFRTLADLGINLEMISTSPIKISCVIARGPRRGGGTRAARRLRARRRTASTPSRSRRARPDGRARLHRRHRRRHRASSAATVRAILEERDFPVAELRLLASERSAGRRLRVQRRGARGARASKRRPSPASTSPSSPPAAPSAGSSRPRPSPPGRP